MGTTTVEMSQECVLALAVHCAARTTLVMGRQRQLIWEGLVRFRAVIKTGIHHATSTARRQLWLQQNRKGLLLHKRRVTLGHYKQAAVYLIQTWCFAPESRTRISLLVLLVDGHKREVNVL